MTSHILDPRGNAWPVTGHWCAICTWPLTPVRRGQDRHLDCAVDVHDELMSHLERHLQADVQRQRNHAGGTPPPGRVWAQMPDSSQDGRLDWIFVFDQNFRVAPDDPCPVCHVSRREPSDGGYGLFLLDAQPDLVFCPGCSAACFCLICGHQAKPADRRYTVELGFPDLCPHCAGDRTATAEAAFELTRQLGARPLPPAAEEGDAS